MKVKALDVMETAETKVKPVKNAGLKRLKPVASPGGFERYAITNRKFAEDNQEFNRKCTNARVKPTARQASKFRNDKGRAYKYGAGVQ